MQSIPIPAWARTLAAAWLWLALLWGAGSFQARLAPWLWLAVLAVLMVLPVWGAWLVCMLRKRALLAQFASQGWVARWFSGGAWCALKALVLVLVLVVATLWQAFFLTPWEWVLLALAPLAYVLLDRGLQRWLAGEFAHPAFAWAWGQRGCRWLITLTLGIAWAVLLVRGSPGGRAAPLPPEALDQAIATIALAPSGLVRWGLDTLLALQVAGGTLRDWPESEVLRRAFLILAGPGVVSVCLGWMLQGANGLQASLRDAARLRSAENPASRAAFTALLAVVGLAIFLPTAAVLDSAGRQHRSPLALERLPECERIGQRFYRLGTLQEVRGLALEALAASRASDALCARGAEVQRELDAALERYLDWYFSLGAEWGRTLRLLTGNADDFLQQRLEATLAEAPNLQGWLAGAAEQSARGEAALTAAQQRISDVLERHHLALTADRCLVRAQAGEVPALDLLGDARGRLGTSAALGLTGGAFAGAIAAKAMGKAGMKAAGKVLAKAAAKQGLAKGSAVAAGAALGSVVPGAGTALGALAGAAAGVALSVGIDWALLTTEEQLTRDGMRADLHAALSEHVAQIGDALGCEAR